MNGEWKQCASCGEVYERQSVILSTHTLSVAENNSLTDITLLPLKVTLMGKLTSRFNLMIR